MSGSAPVHVPDTIYAEVSRCSHIMKVFFCSTSCWDGGIFRTWGDWSRPPDADTIHSLFFFFSFWDIKVKLFNKSQSAREWKYNVPPLGLMWRPHTFENVCFEMEFGNTLPTPDGAGRQWTEGTSIGCNQWLSLAKIALKVPRADRNRSLVARTSRCGECISRGSRISALMACAC
jgi:hypothetical protein